MCSLTELTSRTECQSRCFHCGARISVLSISQTVLGRYEKRVVSSDGRHGPQTVYMFLILAISWIVHFCYATDVTYDRAKQTTQNTDKFQNISNFNSS